MAAVDVHVGRLGDHHQLGPDLFLVDQILPAQTVAVLFHHRAGEEDGELLIQPHLLDHFCRIDHGGHPAFLVDRTAAPDLALPDKGREGIKCPLRQISGIDGVNMGVESDQPRPAADAADDAAQAVDAHLVKPGSLHLLFDHLDDLLLFSRVGGGAHQLHQKAGDFAFQLFSPGSDFLINRIHLFILPHSFLL